MSCYFPIRGYRTTNGVVFSERSRHGDFVGGIEVPCGMCIGCRMRRAQDWTLRCMHEAKMWDSNCFVTLTYARGNLPPNSSLEHRDFQLFMKRVRFSIGPVRFYMCGEYGPKNQRPHYHACLFGVDFRDRIPKGKSKAGSVFYESPTLTKLWGLGIATVQDLTQETASYTARYIMKKLLGQESKRAYDTVDADGVVTTRKAEYSAMSLKPGIGARFFEAYKGDIYRGDFVVSGGREYSPPRYYDKLAKRDLSIDRDLVEYNRQVRAAASFADNTDERRAVRNEVHLARVATLSRGDLSDE